MSTDIAISSTSTALTIDAEQSTFTPQQVSVLRHLGVENASEGDLAVFFHVAKRTGLDPFAKQLYMIGRNTKDQKTNQWITKYTIQTGIDGYRLIGRRAANAAKVKIAVGAPQWAGQDGVWRDLWFGDAVPAAARVTITRDGEPFTAVALFDEYKQTTRDGALTSMWRQRPAGQIAKCAEALAWRLAFPQDLAGIYVEDEMQHVPSEPRVTEVAASGADRLRAALAPEPVEVTVLDVTEDTPAPARPTGPAQVTDAQVTDIMRALTTAGLDDRDEALAKLREVTGRDVRGPRDLTTAEAQTVIDTLTAVTTAAR